MNRKRQEIVQKHFELTKYEANAMRKLAYDCGYSKEAHLIRDLVMNTVPIQLNKKVFDDIFLELNRIGVNINQIAHIANATGTVDIAEYEKQAKELEDTVLELKRLVYQPYEKKDLEDLCKTLRWKDFGSVERNEKSMQLTRALEDFLGIDIIGVGVSEDGYYKNLDNS